MDRRERNRRKPSTPKSVGGRPPPWLIPQVFEASPGRQRRMAPPKALGERIGTVERETQSDDQRKRSSADPYISLGAPRPRAARLDRPRHVSDTRSRPCWRRDRADRRPDSIPLDLLGRSVIPCALTYCENVSTVPRADTLTQQVRLASSRVSRARRRDAFDVRHDASAPRFRGLPMIATQVTRISNRRLSEARCQ